MLQVLIIDDTKSVHAFVKTLLEKAEGITSTSVFNGREGVDLVKSGKTFDLIFLDWEMPVMNGPETLKELIEMGVKAPVIMMTTRNNPEDIQKMLELGAAEYIMKPFTIDILFDKIEFVSGKSYKYAA